MYFVEEGIVLFEITKSTLRNVDDMGNFKGEMSATLNQLQGSPFVFRSSLESFHYVIDQL